MEQAQPTTEQLQQIADEDQAEQTSMSVELGAFRFQYFQARAQRAAQYAAQGYRMPPTDHTMLTYTAFCVSRGLAMMMGHG